MNDQILSFGSRSANLALAEKLVDDVCKKYHVDEDYYGNILIAVTEAVNNAIIHGNAMNPEKLVKVGFEVDEHGSKKELKFTVKDQGKGFDHAGLPDPTDPEHIEKANGRGVFLMQHLADGLTFSDNGSAVELVFCVQ